MDLPELRSKVAAYLDPPQLATAASVCRNWYETFNPILYHKLKWISSTNDIPQPTIAALQANAHHIRDLGIHLGAQIAPLLVCTRLEKLFIALYIHSLETWQQLTQLVRQNPNLRQLSTFMGGQNVTREFTKALSECSGLKHLVPRLGNIDHEAAEFLFDACVQLEYLDLEKSRFTNVESLDRWSKFPAMEHLVMGSPRGMPSRIQYDFIRKCGQLKHLSWSFQNTHTISVTEVCSLFSKYCPRLESVEFEFAPFADEDMACILDTCPKMISLKASPSFFGAQSFRALARHFMFLETLNISSCPWVSSAMSLQLLMSCPQLTMFCANILDARDILGITVDEQDRPTAPLHPQDWVCTNLKTLSVFICGLEGKHAEWQPLVLRQLARMDKLERLHIGLNHPQLTSDGIDLRLACGLDILSSLKHLRAITFHGLLQRMDEDDIRWMLAAWPDLQLLQGQVHDDETRKQELEEILRASLEAFVPEGMQVEGSDTEHHKWMRAALDLALEAHSMGEVPVGCVFVHTPTKEIIGQGRNRTNESLNGTRHAEFEGIDMILAQEKHRSLAQDPTKHFWKDVTLYVTIEPCVMCASALRQLGIGQVYYGAGNDRFGGNGSVFHIHKDENLPHSGYPSEGGYFRGEAIMVLRKFYVGENMHAPEPKKKKHRVLKEDL